MSRRLLMVGQGGGGETPGPPPADPTLTETRAIAKSPSINQNVFQNPEGGSTYDYSTSPVRFLQDCRDVTLIFHGVSQGFITDPTRYEVSVKKPGESTWTPVTFGGQAEAAISPTTAAESDPIAGLFYQSTEMPVRVYAHGPATINIGLAGHRGLGDQLLAETLTATDGGNLVSGPWPLMFKGKTRASVKAFGLYGDSIAAQGLWWSQATAEHNAPGANFGRNVETFGGRWLTAGLTEGLTHMLVQFGVNDLVSGNTVSNLWANAVECYDYITGLNPDIVIWQTTPTPTVDDTAADGCATLVGQTLHEPRSAARQAWVAFLRDGAPCDPDTRAALAVGAGGSAMRAGDTGHPIKGLVDIAAAVEDGGVSAPTGKWRVDLGPLGGDGVHPSGLGQSVMADPVSAWLAAV